ncbi:response regulator [Marinicauda algicola]|uniref:Response regulator n=2 Tax=Marinicauda algicola TaxID=2029849 RepID=A0A4S2H527_9PROT|nr:response regulator [Marinicauda algicola]
MIYIVRTLLHGFGIREIRDTRDAAEALDIIRHETVDIVFSDYEMDLLDGLEFTRMIRTAKDSRNRYVPIILLTAYTERSRICEARDAGVTEVCAKPVTAQQLWQKMSAVINHPRPFVKSKTYFGPDRRRRIKSSYRGPERRHANLEPLGEGEGYSARDSSGL